jgi:hypothetical protein
MLDPLPSRYQGQSPYACTFALAGIKANHPMLDPLPSRYQG